MSSDIASRLRVLAQTYAAARGVEIGDCLGSGGSAAVFVAGNDEKRFALKVYDPAFLAGKGADAERRRLDLQRKLIGHGCRYLVGLRAVVEQEGTCFVEMDHVPWNTLKSMLAGFPDAAVKPLFGQLLEAARFLDAKDIVHRDIKPENILVAPDYSELRLIDLGVVRHANSDEEGTSGTDHGDRRPFVATAQYSSPEYLFRLREPSAESWKALTFYQLGAVLHDMLMKRALFDAAARTDNKYVISMAVFKETPSLTNVPSDLSAMSALAAHCLQKDPVLRLQLVNWERLQAPNLSGLAKLRALAHRSNAAADAGRTLADIERSREVGRARLLAGVDEGVRRRLIATLGQAFVVRGRPETPSVVHVQVESRAGWSVSALIKMTWEIPMDPDRAQATMSAILGDRSVAPTCTTVALGELVDEAAASDTLCETAVEQLGHLLAHASDLVEGSSGVGVGAAVDLVASLGGTHVR